MRLGFFTAAVAALALTAVPAVAAPCGAVVSIATHDGTTTRYSFGAPQGDGKPHAALLLLAGAKAGWSTSTTAAAPALSRAIRW